MTKRSKIAIAAIGAIVAAAALVFGNRIDQQGTTQPISTVVQPMLVITETPSADQNLARENGCFECHGVDQKIIGPSFRDIANRYKTDQNARQALIETIKKGGKGNWTEVSGGIPMPPYSPRLSDSEIEELVDWLLGL